MQREGPFAGLLKFSLIKNERHIKVKWSNCHMKAARFRRFKTV